jgi:hypothetical protein
VRRASRVVFNTGDIVLSRLGAHEVNKTDTLLVTSAAEADGDATMRVTTTFLTQGSGQQANGPAFVDVVIYGSTKVANTRRNGFVCLENVVVDI